LLLWGLRRCSDPSTAGKIGDEIAQAEKRNAELEDELRRKRAAQLMCVPEDKPAPPPVAAAPEPVPSAPQAASAPAPAASPPQAKADPIDELKKRVAAAGTNCDRLGQLLDKEPLLKRNTAQSAPIRQQIMKSLEQNCRERAIKEARNLCPEQRPKELAPQVALVFDASGSMNFNLDATEEQIRQAGGAAQVEALLRQMMGMGGGGNPGGLPPHLTREPRRITVAKPAAVSVVQRMPSDVSVGLVMVDQCPAARPVGMYAPGQRGALIGQIQAIQPRAGTPLADGIAKAGEMVDGVSREAIIVVVSDGTESCGRDPCAVAADLKRRKPHLRINVVDITGTGAGNCAARLTGGQVYTARDAAEVARMMDRAAQEAMGPANCKK
jgi:Mg-chelatase subunit ChlD